MRRSHAAGKDVLDEPRTPVRQRTKRRIHRQSAQAVAKKSRRSVQPLKQFRQHACDETIHIIDRRFIDASAASWRLDGHDLYGPIEQLRPSAERHDAAASIGKAKQTGFRGGVGLGRDQPLWRSAQRGTVANVGLWINYFTGSISVADG